MMYAVFGVVDPKVVMDNMAREAADDRSSPALHRQLRKHCDRRHPIVGEERDTGALLFKEECFLSCLSPITMSIVTHFIVVPMLRETWYGTTRPGGKRMKRKSAVASTKGKISRGHDRVPDHQVLSIQCNMAI